MSLSVLVVDDSMIARAVIKRAVLMCCAQEATFHEAPDGEEALRVLHASPIDLVLADLNMPRLNGAELVARMKQDEALRAIPVLIISSDQGPAVVELVRSGAAGYLAKPFRPEALRQALRDVLAGTLHGKCPNAGEGGAS